MVLCKLPVPGRPTDLIILGQGPTALTTGASGGCLDIFFTRLSFFTSVSFSLGGPSNPKQPTNQPKVNGYTFRESNYYFHRCLPYKMGSSHE